jgi:acetyltransferase-like isoleucine patch superfamily enzyme
MTILDELIRLFKQLRDDKKNRFNRVLPLGEYIVDRWEKARYLGFGEGSSIYDSAIVFGDVKVGKNTWIGPFTILDGSGGLTIGDHCSVSAGTQIYSHDSVRWAVSGGEQGYEYGPTVIEDHCYIGPNTVITKGVTICSGSVVGANSYVDKSWPRGSKIAGNPAKSIE